jgi:hypothetical protein
MDATLDFASVRPQKNKGMQRHVAVVFLGRAGRVYGVDAYLAKRWPNSPLW